MPLVTHRDGVPHLFLAHHELPAVLEVRTEARAQQVMQLLVDAGHAYRDRSSRRHGYGTTPAGNPRRLNGYTIPGTTDVLAVRHLARALVYDRKHARTTRPLF